MEDVGIFYSHLVYFTSLWHTYFVAIWSILRPCGIFCGHLVHFMAIFRFGRLYQEKSGNPAPEIQDLSISKHARIIILWRGKKSALETRKRFG
jgi:hypothetical protein